MTFTAQDMILIIGGLVTLVGAISAAAVAIIKQMQAGQDRATAASAIYAEQKNRELATLGAVPVTNESPPKGTGDGRVDAQVTSQLATAPVAVPQLDPLALVKLVVDELERREAAKNAVPVAVVSEPPTPVVAPTG